MNIGFAMCGSFCTFHKAFEAMREVASIHTVFPILSERSSTLDSRFGSAAEHIETAGAICGRPPLLTIPQVEPIGPKKLLDALVIAPCTGNTLAKLAHSIGDTPVTMAAKSHLRNGRPVVIAVSTNDALAGAAENIGRLLARKHYYFVPFGQDDPLEKPASMVADFSKLLPALEAALEGRQLQPVMISYKQDIS
jgi:dipicolinate synthase subunit B